MLEGGTMIFYFVFVSLTVLVFGALGAFSPENIWPCACAGCTPVFG